LSNYLDEKGLSLLHYTSKDTGETAVIDLYGIAIISRM
jgi:hypothetical protein